MRPSSEGGKRSGSRYVLGDLLGRGGMAEVFAGHAVGDHGFQKPVAIKRLLPELANDEVFVERLIEEAKLLVGMQHGNIVSVLDLAREGDDVFLVMEFVDGPSLRQLIKARGTRGLSLGTATYIVQSAAAGLEFAHARPGGAVIHADISPSNLLLTTSGEVRVADFGIARREGLNHGVVEGKWAYMAPEQARGEALTPRSDVFALGVVLYELLTGQHPFGRAVTANERDEQIPVIPPRVVKPTVPPGLDAICMRALAHHPRDRYGRMQQLIDALVEERFANGYRDGASDLAQAIREVALKTDPGSPRTMHTDRPVTIVTRSLLRDVTPARRPSQPPAPQLVAPPVLAPALPTQLPPPTQLSSEFAVPTSVPTRVLEAVPDPYAAVPTMAPTSVLPTDVPPPNEFPAVPTSGAQTVARMVDQLALAQVAQAAAAMLAAAPQPLSAALRADGTPMPPFRVSYADMRGEELASVVGGHTLTGHGAAVALEPRGHRWTIIVLAMAALIGVGAAVVIQINSSSADRAAASRTPDETALVASGESTERAPSARRTAEEAPRAPQIEAARGDEHDAALHAAAQRPVQPTIPESSPEPTARLQDVAPPSGGVPEAKVVESESVESKHSDSKISDSKADDSKISDSKADDSKVADERPSASADQSSGDSKSGRAKSKRGKAGRKVSDASADATSGDADDGRGERSDGKAGKRGSRDKRKLGMLLVEAKPWAWVTVDIETIESPARFYLTPGTHIVKLYNEDNGLTRYEKVVVEADKTQRLVEDMSK